MDKAEALTDFFIESNKLKKTLRYSSCLKEVQESSADHSWKVALMVPIIAGEFELKLDILHAMEIAIVHDLAEYELEKDFDSYLVAKGILSKTEKDKSEEKVMSSLKERFYFGPKLYSLWKEFEESETPESRFVKALDKLESHIHVIERGVAGEGSGDAEHQILYADKAVKNFPELKPLLKAIKKKLRPVLEKRGLIWKEEYNYPD